MYNQEIKERFLAEFTARKNEKSCRSKFEAMGQHETLLDKDFAEMSAEEAISAMKYVRTGTYGSAFALISQVRAYVKWCSENKVFQNVNAELGSLTVDDVDISDNLRKLLFKDEDELIKELRKVRPFDDGYYDVIVMIFAWLGISQDQGMSIKVDAVNLDNMTVRVDSKIVMFSDNLRDILRTYSRTKTGTRLNKNGPREVYRDDSFDLFIRKFAPPKQLGKKLTKSQVQDAVYSLNEAYEELGNEPRFTVGNVLASGALRRVYDLEKSGVNVFTPKSKTAVTDVFGTGAKLHEILWLYRNYKRAFNL